MALGTVNVSSPKEKTPTSTDVGAVPYKGLASDLNTVMESGEFGFYEFNGNTKNTPYTEGISTDDTGIVMNLPQDADGYSQQIAFFSGNFVPCFRHKSSISSGGITEWKLLFVPTSGGIVTGPFTATQFYVNPELCAGHIYGEENQLTLMAGNPETGEYCYVSIKSDGLYVNGNLVYSAEDLSLDRIIRIHDDSVEAGTDLLSLNAGIHSLVGNEIDGLPDGHSGWGTIEICRYHDYDWGHVLLTDSVNNKSWISFGNWSTGLVWQEIFTDTSLPTLTVTGVDEDGRTHTWTMYGVAE